MKEQELSVVDYLKVVLRRKNFIFGALLTFLIIAAALSFLKTQRYQAVTIVEIGYFMPRKIGAFTCSQKEYLEGQVQLAEKIKAGIYSPKILEEVRLQPKDLPKIEATPLRESFLVMITAQAKNPELAERVLQALDKTILEDHQRIAESLKEIDILQPTKILKEPQAAQNKGNFVLNLVVGGVLGLLLGILGAFCLDWWEKNRKKLTG